MHQQPLIGISCSWAFESSGPFSRYPKNYANDGYVDSVARAGGIPILLPLLQGAELEAALPKWLERIDGLILIGGQDIRPEYYGEQPRQKIGETFPARDLYDLALLKGALERKLPIFTVCRGFQLINAYFGGKLLQDLGYSEHELLKHDQDELPEVPTHRVQIEKDSFFYETLGAHCDVNSFHHQTVLEAGEGLKVAARAADGVIEAVQSEDARLLGVQWHPEMMSCKSSAMLQLFRRWLDLCRS